MEKTYVIKDGSITCLTCGRTSYNQNDVKNKYCGYCHKFHEDVQIVNHINENSMEFLIGIYFNLIEVPELKHVQTWQHKQANNIYCFTPLDSKLSWIDFVRSESVLQEDLVRAYKQHSVKFDYIGMSGLETLLSDIS